MTHHTFSGTKLIAVVETEGVYAAHFTQVMIGRVREQDVRGLTIGKTYDITIKERDDERREED